MNEKAQDCPSGAADGFEIRADAELVAAGWERRFLADPDRAKEATELYTGMGFEVLARPLTPAEFGPLCGQCPASSCVSYVMIYTRRKSDD